MSTLLNKGENLEKTHPFTPLPTAVTTPAPDIAVPPGEKGRCLDVNDGGTWPHQSRPVIGAAIIFTATSDPASFETEIKTGVRTRSLIRTEWILPSSDAARDANERLRTEAKTWERKAMIDNNKQTKNIILIFACLIFGKRPAGRGPGLIIRIKQK